MAPPANRRRSPDLHRRNTRDNNSGRYRYRYRYRPNRQPNSRDGIPPASSYSHHRRRGEDSHSYRYFKWRARRKHRRIYGEAESCPPAPHRMTYDHSPERNNTGLRFDSPRIGEESRPPAPHRTTSDLSPERNNGGLTIHSPVLGAPLYIPSRSPFTPPSEFPYSLTSPDYPRTSPVIYPPITPNNNPNPSANLSPQLYNEDNRMDASGNSSAGSPRRRLEEEHEKLKVRVEELEKIVEAVQRRFDIVVGHSHTDCYCCDCVLANDNEAEKASSSEKCIRDYYK